MATPKESMERELSLNDLFSFENYYDPCIGGIFKHAYLENKDSLTAKIEETQKLLKTVKASSTFDSRVNNSFEYFNFFCRLMNYSLQDILSNGVIKFQSSAGNYILQCRCLAPLVYLAQLQNISGIIAKDTLAPMLQNSIPNLAEFIQKKGANLEGGAPFDYLFLRSWSLISLIFDINNEVLSIAKLFPTMSKETAISKLIYELAVTMEALSNYLDITGCCKDPLSGANNLKRLTETISSKIGRLEGSQEYAIVSGGKSKQDGKNHAIYVVFARNYDSIVIRIDNAGKGFKEFAHPQDGLIYIPGSKSP